MTELERLIAIDAIKQLKSRYFRGLDRQDEQDENRAHGELKAVQAP